MENIRELIRYILRCFGLVDFASTRGDLVIELHSSDGTLRDRRAIHNLVVNVGLAHIADQMSDQGEAQMSHMAIGSGTTAAAAGDTALESELARVAFDSVTQSTSSVIYVATFGAGVGTGAVTEAGILNAAVVGTLLCRSVFAVVNKGAADVMTITWTLTFTAA